MATTPTVRHEVPRLHGKAEIVPLSFEQYQRMLEASILHAGDPVDWVDGYLVLKDSEHECSWLQGLDPYHLPRLDGEALLWPLSIDEYRRMIAAGILVQGSPIELIEGYLVAKDRGRGPGMTQNPMHATSVQMADDLFREALGRRGVVRCQLPVSLGPAAVRLAGSEPEPDVAVAKGPNRRYSDHHPRPEELYLVLEVADTSLAYDRDLKARLYASAGIVQYWILNLLDRQLEIYSDPDPAAGQYRSQQTLAEDQQVVLHWDGLSPVNFVVREFLP